MWLVTGPNMAGKSTFLRQNALIALLAQAGSYVPARSAHIGVVDRLFSRVGASDDLARGRSTFMVEMVETAAILNQATERSLVILDEIGRGTATFDGLSIAWATLEYLHDVAQSRALFATHYHELTQLAGRLGGARVRDDGREGVAGRDRVPASRAPGVADRSYGIQVAKLAGLPAKVVGARRRGAEAAREAAAGATAARAVARRPAAVRGARPRRSQAAAPRGPSPVEALLDATNADDLTPRAALDLVYRLKELRAEPQPSERKP